jgi:hypothetical protein
MNCAEFEKHFDFYIDDLLAPALMREARDHLTACPTCEKSVTRFQQTRVLLSTAVAEVASAVDVSGLWKSVESRLGELPSGALEPTVEVVRVAPAAVRPGLGQRVLEWARDSFSEFGYGWSAGLMGTASAAAAAVIMFAVTAPAPDATSPGAAQVASAPAPVDALRSANVRTVASAEPRAGRASLVSATVGQPVARNTRNVRLDSIRTSPGHLVSTWVMPKQKARVIWVADAENTNKATASTVEFRK